MREIKFRVWDNRIDEMRTDRMHVVDGVLYFEKYVAPECYEIMQSTNLKDKNGKEIFEGDVIKKKNASDSSNSIFKDIKDYISVVEFKYSCWYVGYGNFKNWCLDRMDEYNCKHIEVIGNIYENPELLGDKNV